MNRSIIQYCSTCTDLAGFYCNGCNKIFCENHSDEHRQSFYDQLDWLTVDHDDLVHTLNNTSTITQTSHSSRKIIDRWEEESINYIRKTANDARRALIDAVNTHINEVKQRLKVLTEQLNNVYENKYTFDERNIKQWATQLYNIKNEFVTSPTFTVRIHGNKPVVMPIIKIQPDFLVQTSSNQQQQKTSFGLVPIRCNISSDESSSNNTKQEITTIRRTSIDQKTNTSVLPQKDDRFYTNSDHIKILDNGQLILHDATNNDASVRGCHEYSQGEHKLFFRIENIASDQWIFLGIISKTDILESKAYMDKSAHGWAGYNNVYINGKSMPILNGFVSEMKANDFIELTIDCDKQILYLWHSQQTYKNKLPVDIRTCPFPWQLLVSCHHAYDSLRILPSAMGVLIKKEQDKFINNDVKIKEIDLNNGHDFQTIRWGLHLASTVR